MRFAYADPPYLGCGKLYPEQQEVDHVALIARLIAEFPDGWALSFSSPSLRTLLPLCPEDVRVLAWVKPFASFKPGVTLAYAWEPVILRGGRRRPRTMDTVRDWVAVSITLQKGLVGAKPEAFCRWLFDVLGVQPDDELIDLFPGTNAIGQAWRTYVAQSTLFVEAES